MSETNVNADNPAMEHVDATPSDTGPSKWAYSGKAMRAQCILYWIITILVLLGTYYANKDKEWISSNAPLLTWSVVGVSLFALWAHFSFLFFCYRTRPWRLRCILYSITTILAIGGTCYATTKWIPDNASMITGIMAGVLLLALWVHFCSAYIYRTWTIRYELSGHRLDIYQGLFVQTKDTTELMYIEDMQMVRTIWDRLFCGGVGKIVVYSTADKTDKTLVLIGIEHPKERFDQINAERLELRKKRAFITGG